MKQVLIAVVNVLIPPLPKAISDYFKALGKKSYKAKVKKMGKAKVAEDMRARALKRWK